MHFGNVFSNSALQLPGGGEFKNRMGEVGERFGRYLPIFTEPEANNCCSIILRCGRQKVKNKIK